MQTTLLVKSAKHKRTEQTITSETINKSPNAEHYALLEKTEPESAI